MAESAPEKVPYAVLAALFRDSGIVPFLGAGASVAGASVGTALPTGNQLAQRIAKVFGYPGDTNDPLSKVAQYLEEVQADRGFLLGQIAEFFYSTSLSRFLHLLPPPLRPRLIITTNYDLLVEMALPPGDYLAVSQIRRGTYKSKFLCNSDWRESMEGASEILTLAEVNARIDTLREQRPHAVVIYKFHGTARLVTTGNDKIDSVVLTESDYVDFLTSNRGGARNSRSWWKRECRSAICLFWDIPFRIGISGCCSVGWTGFKRTRSPRVMTNERHWAILRKPDMVESQFWRRRNVNLYDVALEEFLDQLGAAIGSSS